jgi:hypothetical protein
MSWTLGIALAFLVLLFFEWRMKSRILRLLAIVMALGVFGFSTPSPYRALRHAVEREHVTQNLWVPERRATEFESGLFTMYQAMVDDTEMGARDRAVSFGVLTWLAFSPILWGLSSRKAAPTGTSSPDAVSSRAA